MSYQFPFKQHKVTNVFGKLGSWSAGWHIGTDLVGIGDTMVYPIAEGIVESVNAHGKDYGNHLTIKHADGNVSLYAHLANLKVIKGQAVTLDTKLGQMGATGRAFGAHLHLELHKGRWQYPLKGSKPSSAPWIIDPISFIEANLAKSEEEVAEVRYKKLEDVPAWGRKTIEKLILKGIISGNSNGELDLSEDMVRMIVMNDRAGLYDLK